MKHFDAFVFYPPQNYFLQDLALRRTYELCFTFKPSIVLSMTWSDLEWAAWSGWRDYDRLTDSKQQWSWASQPDTHDIEENESCTWADATQSSTCTQTTEGKTQHTWVWRKPASRSWTHIILHIDRKHKEFELVPRLIGRGGVHMKTIALAHDAKLRVRGYGSGHLEVDGRREAPVPLMLTVSANKKDPEAFQKAVNLAIQHLKNTESHYKDFCYQKGFMQPGPMFSIGEMSPYTGQVLKELVNLYPHPEGPKETNLLDGAARGQNSDIVTCVAPHKPVHVPPPQFQKCTQVLPYSEQWQDTAEHDALTTPQFMPCQHLDDEAWFVNGWHGYDWFHAHRHLYCPTWLEQHLPAYSFLEYEHSHHAPRGWEFDPVMTNIEPDHAVKKVLSTIWATIPVSPYRAELFEVSSDVTCSVNLLISPNTESNELDQMMRSAITEFFDGADDAEQ